MKSSRVWMVWVGAVIALPAFAAMALAAEEMGLVQETAGEGLREVRTVTVGATPVPGGGNQEPEIPAGAPTKEGTILWLDQDHQDAIAERMALSGDGTTVVTGWWLNNARVSTYETDGSAIPLWSYPIATTFFVPVGISGDASLIAGTGRQDSLHTWGVTSPVPICSEGFPPGYEGDVAIVPDVGGQFAGASTFPDGESSVQVHGDLCDLRFQEDLIGRVQGARYSAGGDWVVANSRTTLYVYASATGALRGTVDIPGETQVAAGISADGAIIATGGFSRTVRVYRWDGGRYVELWNHLIPSVTWITAIDVSDDGSTVMVGTWYSTSPYLGRVLLYDVAAGPTPLWTNSSFGDYVNSVALSADGARGIAGSWGRLDGTFGHLVAAFDRGSATPFFTVDDDEIAGVASAFVVDISNDGYRASAGGKAVHARDFGRGGYAMALDLGGTTPVDLVRFEGRVRPDCTIELGWSTGFERGHAGFHVSRATVRGGRTGDPVLLTASGVIPSEPEVAGYRTYRLVDEGTACGRTYVYYLDQVDLTGHEERLGSLTITAAPGSPAAAPAPAVVLGQNRPNPFRAPVTEIPFTIGERSWARLVIVDAAGRAVRVLDLGERDRGAQTATWDGRDDAGNRLPTGAYFYRLEAAGQSATQRLLLLN